MSEKTKTPKAPAPAPVVEKPATPPPADVAPVAPEASAPEKRGRGRPRKDAAAPPISPSEAGQAKTASKKAKYKAAKIDGGQLAKQLKGLHLIAAMGTGIPEFEISDDEAAMLGEAVAHVCEEYDLSISGKTGAFLQLLFAGAMVYGPRVQAVGTRIKEQQARQRALRVVGGTDAHGADPAHS